MIYNDLDCLDNIRKNLEVALINLYEAREWINNREKDYFHYCDGFDRLVHQVENLRRAYNYEYLEKSQSSRGGQL